MHATLLKNKSLTGQILKNLSTWRQPWWHLMSRQTHGICINDHRPLYHSLFQPLICYNSLIAEREDSHNTFWRTKIGANISIDKLKINIDTV